MRRLFLFALTMALFLNAAVTMAEPLDAARAGVSGEENGSAPTVSDRIPFKQEEPVSGAFLGKLLAVLLVLLGATAGVLYAAKRYMGSVPGGIRSSGKIETIEIRRLTPRLTLFLMRVRGREVLLAQSGDSLVVIGEGYEQAARSDHTGEKG